MVLRSFFLFLFLNHIFASPIESASMTDHTDADLDSFELAIDYPEKKSPFSLDDTEDFEETSEATSLYEEAVAESPPSQADLEFAERIKNDQIFFEYLKPLRGCTLGTLYRILDKDPHVFPLLNEYDQNNLAFSLTPESFLSPNRDSKPYAVIRDNTIEFDRNWPQISAERVAMSSLTCQSLKLFISAASKGNTRLVKYFLHKNLVDLSRPIHSASSGVYFNFLSYLLNNSTFNLEIFRVILEHVHAKAPWLINMYFDNGIPPLHAAIKYARNEALGLLLQLGADVNLQYGLFGSAVMHAIHRRNLPALAAIAATGKTNLSLVTSEGLDIFDFIKRYRCVEGIDVLMKATTNLKAGPFFRFIQSAFEENAAFGKACLIRVLLSPEKARIESSLQLLLINFTIKGQFDAVKTLFNYNIKPNKFYTDRNGIHMTLLHIAAHYGHKDLILFYLKNGISPSELSSTRLLPIEIAAAAGNWSVVEFMLNNTENAHAQEALFIAMRFKKLEVVRGMVARFSNLDEIRIDNQPLWMYAFEKRDFKLFSALLSGRSFNPHYVTTKGLSLSRSITGEDSAPFQQAALRYTNRFFSQNAPSYSY